MLNDIAFKQITANYWHAAYGPFRVVMMKDSGYINATKLCISGGKEYKNWSRLQSSQELIQSLEQHEALENTHNTFVCSNSTLLDGNAHIWSPFLTPNFETICPLLGGGGLIFFDPPPNF